MTDDDLRLLVDMLTLGTPTEKEYASQKFDEWIVSDQHEYIEYLRAIQ